MCGFVCGQNSRRKKSRFNGWQASAGFKSNKVIMSHNNVLSNISNLTMGTREIADMLSKQHSKIKISAERLAASGVIGTLAAQEFNACKFTPKGVEWIAGLIASLSVKRELEAA
jgi:hypothetical protein